MSQRARLAVALIASACACLSALGVACGSGASSAPAKSGKGTTSEKTEEGQGDDGAEADEEQAPPTSRCNDGTCFECGAGLCPKGFYCDEKAPGGPACGWLPECAASASCSCVKQVLGSGCSCTEKASGVSVSCQGL